MTKGKSLRSSQLIITGRASILISNSINITTKVTTIVLVLRCLGRRRRRLYEATKASLSSSNMTDMGVHLIQLSSECIKASIHALKLCHDRLEGHTTRGGRRSGCGRSERSQRSHHLGPWLLQSKLGLTPFNGRHIYDTHHGEVRRLGIGDRRMANDPHDSRRENKLITDLPILDLSNYK